jgi:hypothetical protein
MALNKSGLPPMKNPMSAAVRPGGPGTVKPGSAKLNLGSLGGPKQPKTPGGPTKIGKGVPMANFRGGGSTSKIPKMPKLPKIG